MSAGGFNLTALAVRERQVALFFLLIALAAGLLSFLRLGRAEDPAFTVRIAVVTALWPGASAEEMVRQVADPIERRAQEIADIYRIETTARPGRVDVQVEFQDFVPSREVPDRFYQLRKRMDDLAPLLPRGVQGPFVNDEFSDVYFTLIGLIGPGLPQRLLVEEAERLRDGLQRLPGVQKVRLIGEQPQRLHVDLDLDRLGRFGLTPAQVAAAIAAANAVAPAGLIETLGPRLTLRSARERADPEALAQVPIAIEGRSLALGEIARISRGVEEPPSYLVRVGGQEALLLGVVMARGVNGLELGARIAAFLDEARADLPAGLELTRVTDQAEAIARAVNLFEDKFLVALAVVMGVSMLAIGLRAGLIVGIAVPITLGLTFLVMLGEGIALDRISLGALIIALGLLVDDAIIAIESMLVKLEEGWEKARAAAHAWSVTAAPMFWGTLATAIGFIPIGFARSGVGEYAGNIFWVVGTALIVSWLVAVTFTPVLGTLLLRPPRAAEAHDPYQTPLYRAWRAVVRGMIRARLAVVATTVALLIASGFAMAVLVPKQFFPASDRPEVLVDIQLPPGSSIAATDAVTRRVEAALAARPEVRSLSAYVGAGAPRFFLALNPEQPDPAFAKIIAVTGSAAERERVIAEMRALVAEGAFPEARLRVTTLLFGPPVPWPVAFRVLGPDPTELRRIAEEVRRVMARHPNVLDPHLDWGPRSAEPRLVIDEARLAGFGLTAADLAQQLDAALVGSRVSEARIGTRSVAIMLRGARRTADEIESLPIAVPGAGTVPLLQLGRIELDFTDPVLKRLDRQPVLRVQADPVGAQAPDVEAALWEALAPLRAALPPGYRIEKAGTLEASARGDASIQALQPVMILLLLSVVMMQIRRFSGLLLVMATAPLGLIGAVLGLLVTGKPFGFVALLGLIGLAGILIRNTLILVQQFRENEAAGMARETALIEATVRRSRPVVLTALAAVLAFIPLALDTFWGPLAVVLIGGTAIGTLITLLFLPALAALVLRIRTTPGLSA
jgi:multidrug efflux pump subunit AcrB